MGCWKSSGLDADEAGQYSDGRISFVKWRSNQTAPTRDRRLGVSSDQGVPQLESTQVILRLASLHEAQQASWSWSKWIPYTSRFIRYRPSRIQPSMGTGKKVRLLQDACPFILTTRPVERITLDSVMNVCCWMCVMDVNFRHETFESLSRHWHFEHFEKKLVDYHISWNIEAFIQYTSRWSFKTPAKMVLIRLSTFEKVE